MTYIFEVVDSTERMIHLTRERWAHIHLEHPEIVEPEELAQILHRPDTLLPSDRDEKVGWYFRYQKHDAPPRLEPRFDRRRSCFGCSGSHHAINGVVSSMLPDMIRNERVTLRFR